MLDNDLVDNVSAVDTLDRPVGHENPLPILNTSTIKPPQSEDPIGHFRARMVNTTDIVCAKQLDWSLRTMQD